MSFLITGLLGLYFIARIIWPLPLPKIARFAIAAVLMPASVHHLISRFVFGTMFSPEVPGTMMVVVNVLYGTILLGAILLLAMDLTALLVSVIRRRRTGVARGLRFGAGLIALGLAGFAVSQAVRLPEPKQVEVAIRGLPQDMEGLRILHLTDLHISRMFERPFVERLVERANAQNADLILITGDLIDGTIAARREDVAPLAGLKAPLGVYVIPGNHEYYFGYEEWMARFRDLGLKTLANSHAVIERNGARLVVAGVTDRAAGAVGLPGPDVGAALAGRPAGVPVIMLDHQPRNAALAAKAGAALQLSGHTHGGMIRGFDRLIAAFNNGYVSGRYDVGEMTLYVSNGTMLWIGFALRLGVPSELTTIVLRSA